MLSSIFARIGIAVFVVVLAFGAGWLRGHNRGFDAATKHYTAVVQACMNANAQNDATITGLKEANAAFANEAASQQAQAQAALKALRAQQAQSKAALSAAQSKLDKALHANQDASTWAGTRVPAGIASQLR